MIELINQKLIQDYSFASSDSNVVYILCLDLEQQQYIHKIRVYPSDKMYKTPNLLFTKSDDGESLVFKFISGTTWGGNTFYTYNREISKIGSFPNKFQLTVPKCIMGVKHLESDESILDLYNYIQYDNLEIFVKDLKDE